MSMEDITKAWQVDCDFVDKLALLWMAEDSSSNGDGSWWRYRPERLQEVTQIPSRMIPDIIRILIRDSVLIYAPKMTAEHGEVYYLLNIDAWLNTPRYVVVDEELDEEPAPKRRPRTEPGYVYLLEGQGCFKIGRAKNPQKRSEQLAIQLPYEVELVAWWQCNDYVAAESALHSRFESNRLNGEWFDFGEMPGEDVADLLYEHLLSEWIPS